MNPQNLPDVLFLHARLTTRSRLADVYEIGYSNGASDTTLLVDHDRNKAGLLDGDALTHYRDLIELRTPVSLTDAAWTLSKVLQPAGKRRPVVVMVDALVTVQAIDRLLNRGGVGPINWPRVIDLGDLTAGYACGAHTVEEEPLTDWTGLDGILSATGYGRAHVTLDLLNAGAFARAMGDAYDAITTDAGGRCVRGEDEEVAA